MRLIFSERSWDQYIYWQDHGAKMLARLNRLIGECRRTPFAGTGKPEPLRGQLSGWWSRRITREHRLVYRVVNDAILIAQCRFQY